MQIFVPKSAVCEFLTEQIDHDFVFDGLLALPQSKHPLVASISDTTLSADYVCFTVSSKSKSEPSFRISLNQSTIGKFLNHQCKDVRVANLTGNPSKNATPHYYPDIRQCIEVGRILDVSVDAKHVCFEIEG